MDRNGDNRRSRLALDRSLSARRAWIEIRLADMSAAWNRSLSARRAWIEIDFAGSAWVSEFRRSPQGERG